MIDARLRKAFPGGRGSTPFELNVELKSGAEVTVLFGPSGAGKSLTLDCIAGFVRPDEGRILVNDRLLFDAGAGVNLPPRLRRCGCVFPDDSLFPHMNLFENLWFAAARLSRRARRQKVGEMLERFHLEDLGARRPYELSSGQRQRGSIARALLSQPALLLLDEPVRGLDAALRMEFYALLREVRGEFGVPVVLVTHDLDEALELGESMHVLVAGKIAQSGAPREIFAAPASAAVARLMDCYNLLRAEIVALDPTTNRSRLHIATADGTEFDLIGPYFPGLLLGAKVTLAVREDEIEHGPELTGGVQLDLRRVARLSRGVRVELSGGIHVAVGEAPASGVSKQWNIRFRPQSLRLVKA
ncbi:MAG: ATP-binding cassette domain-containing protein [Bryobacteraceae bacterium]